MHRITADFIYTPDRLLTDYYIELQEDGTLISLKPIEEKVRRLSHYEGILFPGFVNAHCHLELSAFRGKLKEGLGMTAFAAAIVQERNNIDDHMQQAAMYDAIREAYFTGTVAIGDICNTNVSIAVKRDFPKLYTHSFIELLGLNESQAHRILENGKELGKDFDELSHSLSLHAPYSVSAPLRDAVYQSKQALYSVHLLESKAERHLFAEKSGDFITFFNQINIPTPDFNTSSPADYLLHNLPSSQPVVFVHCLQAKEEEIADLAARFPQAYFCLCPRSNHFIHGEIPDLNRFEQVADRICLGTDSLASNHSLQMLAEIQLLQQHYPDLPLHRLLRWATTQGAEALQLANSFGAFTPLSKPGVNLLSNLDLEGMRLTPSTSMMKLF